MSVRIRINKTPLGFVDESLREKWVGVEMTAEPDSGEDGGWSSDENAGGYVVRGVDAVEALRDAGEEGAAMFWGSPVPPLKFRFSADCCEVID